MFSPKYIFWILKRPLKLIDLKYSTKQAHGLHFLYVSPNFIVSMVLISKGEVSVFHHALHSQ